MPYRLIYIGLALLGVAAIALGILFSTEGDPLELPGPIEAISPEPDSLMPLQTTVEIDLEVGYEATIWVDGWPVDARFVQATGVYSWGPGPNSPVMTEWTPGEHTVRVEWDTYAGLPDPGSYVWSFRIG